MEKNSPFKRGVVTLLDADGARVRVRFEDEDDVQTFWLSVMSTSSTGQKTMWMPRIGQQVVCLVDWEGEDGVVIGGSYSKTDRSPLTVPENDHTTYEDKAIVEHDPVTHVNRVQLSDANAVRYVEVEGGGGVSRIKITPDKIIFNKAPVIEDIPKIPVRGQRA